MCAHKGLDIADGHGLKVMKCVLSYVLLKERKYNIVFAFIFNANKTEHFSFDVP